MGPEETGMEIDLSLKLDAQREERTTEDQDDRHRQEVGKFPAEGKRETEVEEEAVDQEGHTTVDNSVCDETMKTEEVYLVFFETPTAIFISDFHACEFTVELRVRVHLNPLNPTSSI